MDHRCPPARKTPSPREERLGRALRAHGALGLAGLLAGLAQVLAPGGARAVEQTQVAACLASADLARRLACYDGLSRALPPSTTTAASTPASTALPRPSDAVDYPTIDLLDLKVDRDRLIGRGVTTAGRLNVSGQVGFLRSQGIDNTPLFVSIARLPAETQRDIRARCGSACSVVLRGKIAQVTLGIGLAAEEASIRTTTP